jgi:plastocyanin
MSIVNGLCARALGATFALLLLAPVGAAFGQDADAVVDMQGLANVPTEIHVAPGATVLWTNSSPLAHTVTADDGAFDSGNIDAGGTFSMTFDAPGFYTYYCAPHKTVGMLGVVVVDDPNAIVEEMPEPAPAVNPRSPDDYTPDH